MLLGHDAGTAAFHKLSRLLVPEVDPAMVRLILGRTGYGTPKEQEAEALASHILEHGSIAPSPKPTVGPGSAHMMYRLGKLWGKRSCDGAPELLGARSLLQLPPPRLPYNRRWVSSAVPGPSRRLRAGHRRPSGCRGPPRCLPPAHLGCC
jgi:hypothetical protein